MEPASVVLANISVAALAVRCVVVFFFVFFFFVPPDVNKQQVTDIHTHLHKLTAHPTFF